MKGLVLEATWDPRPGYALSDWERETRTAVSGSKSLSVSLMSTPGAGTVSVV